MNTKHLEYFITIAELGSLNKAAQTLFISQPQLGKIIRDLEDDMGVPLFTRTAHGMILTQEGEEFQRHARVVLQETQKLCSIRAHSARNSLVVSMTKFSHIMESFIEITLRHKEDPAFTHRLNEGSPEEVIEDIRCGHANLGVIHFDSQRREKMDTLFRTSRLEYHFLAYVRPHILLSKRHPLIEQGLPVNLQTLADYPFVRYIGQFEDFIYRINAENKEHNLNQSQKIIYIAGRASLLHLLSKSDFYSIGIHDFSMQSATYQVISVPVEEADGMLEFGYLLQEGAALPPITGEFVEDLHLRFQALEEFPQG